jgi:hypothetical protein
MPGFSVAVLQKGAPVPSAHPAVSQFSADQPISVGMVAAENRPPLSVAEDLPLLIEDEIGNTPAVKEQFYFEKDLRLPAVVLAPRYGALLLTHRTTSSKTCETFGLRLAADAAFGSRPHHSPHPPVLEPSDDELARPGVTRRPEGYSLLVHRLLRLLPAPLQRRVSLGKTTIIFWALRSRANSLSPRSLYSGFSAKRVYSTPCG